MTAGAGSRRRGLIVVWAVMAVTLAAWAFIGGHWLAGVYLVALPAAMAARVVAGRRRQRRLDVHGRGGWSG